MTCEMIKLNQAVEGSQTNMGSFRRDVDADLLKCSRL